MKEIEEYLWNLTVTDLQKHSSKLEIKQGKNKFDKIENILNFYRQENWLETYFKNLKGFDLEYTYLIVQHNYRPINEMVQALLEKYEVKYDYYNRFQDNLKFSNKNSIAKILTASVGISKVASLPFFTEPSFLQLTPLILVLPVASST